MVTVIAIVEMFFLFLVHISFSDEATLMLTRYLLQIADYLSGNFLSHIFSPIIGLDSLWRNVLVNLDLYETKY